MKLLFICTSLEPGRDGVGDYTRLLAEACIEAGHDCHMLALHDPFLTNASIENQRGRAREIPCLRLPQVGTWTEKTIAVQHYVETAAPDWISWQIVPYGFHPKGIIPDEAKALSLLSKGRNNHILLHELWIGLSEGEPFKNRGWGTLQRRGLKKFISSLHASALHTTNTTYQEVLKREGWHAEILPLFGNIPVVNMPSSPANMQKWMCGIFGTVHPQFDPKTCFDSLVAGAKVSHRKLVLLGIGRMGEYGEKMFAELERHYAGQIETTLLGEKTPEEVSSLLQTLDFGIATHPWALAGKSGAVAAMLDHGLPVIVSRDDWALRKRPFSVQSIDPLMIRLSQMPPELMAGRLARRQAPSPRLPAIATTFLSRLGALPTPAVPEHVQ